MFVYLYKNIKIYGIRISLSVLHGCETCSIVWRAEHMIKTFQNRAPRKLFPSKVEEIGGRPKKKFTVRSSIACTSGESQSGDQVYRIGTQYSVVLSAIPDLRIRIFLWFFSSKLPFGRPNKGDWGGRGFGTQQKEYNYVNFFGGRSEENNNL